MPSLFNLAKPSSSRASRSTSTPTSPAPPKPPPPTPTTQSPQPASVKVKPTSAFAFTQITVTSFDRAESFFERVFGWRFIGEPTSPTTPAPMPRYSDEGIPQRVAPPIAPPPDHRVNYFAQTGKGGRGIAGALYKFGKDSRARNFSGDEGAGKGEGDGGETRIPNVIHYVAVEDIAITLNAIRLAGGKTVREPWKERDEMAKFALFEDTEGNVFGLIQYLM